LNGDMTLIPNQTSDTLSLSDSSKLNSGLTHLFAYK
jgi:hypothetical protein